MKEILKNLVCIFSTFTMLFVPSFAILPKIQVGTGGYYVNPGLSVYIEALYNNTEVYLDYGNLTQTITLNAQENITATSRIIITDKPVYAKASRLYISPCVCSSQGKYSYAFSTLLPSAQFSGTEFFIPGGYSTIYITAFQYHTEVNVTDSSGTTTYDLHLPGDYFTLSNPEAGTVIKSNKPIVVIGYYYYRYGCYNHRTYAYTYGNFFSSPVYFGKEFYIPYGYGKVKISATEDNTKVSFDKDRDGIPEASYILNKGESITTSDYDPGARIMANTSVFVIYNNNYVSGYTCGGYGQYAYAYGDSLPSSEFLGTEYYIPDGYSRIYITAIQYLTEVNITNSSGTYTYNLAPPHLGPPSGWIVLTDPEAGTVIKSNKPIVVIGYYNYISECQCTYSYGIYAYAHGESLLPLSPSLLVKTPGFLAPNEIGTIKVRVFNPSSTTIYNVSVEVRTPVNLSLVGEGGNVTLNIYKKNASTDTIISSQTSVSVPYSTEDDETVFTVDNSVSSFFASLEKDEYLEIEYQIIPLYIGWYVINTNSTWYADHWFT